MCAKYSDIRFKASDTGIEYFKFPSDEWETLSIRDYPANFSVSLYLRRSGDSGHWEKKPNHTFNSGTSGFVVELRLKRYAGYYNCNLMVPVIVIVMIGFFTVFLPSDSGDKINLAVTVLLGFLFVQGIMANLVPKSESTPLLAIYVVYALIISTGNVAATACVVAIHNLPEDKTPPAIVRVFGIRVMNVLLCRQPKYTLATIRRASAAILHTLYTARDQPRHHSPVLRDEDRDCRQLQLNTGRAEGRASAAGAQSDQTSRGHAREVEESLLANRESSPIDEHELKSHSNIRPPLLVSSATDSSPPGDTDGQTTGSGHGPVRDPATNVEEEKQKGETWQEFAQVLNILVSISYIVAIIVTSAVFLWPLWFSEQKQLGS